MLRERRVGHLPAPLAQLIEETLGDGRCRPQSELPLPDGAGQVMPLMCSTTPLLGPQGGLVGASAVLNDLARVNELEREKWRTAHLAAIESIASGPVHEIQNLLVAIKTFIQLLPSRGDNPEPRDRLAGVAEITRIDDLVRRFRTLAMPRHGPWSCLTSPCRCRRP